MSIKSILGFNELGLGKVPKSKSAKEILDMAEKKQAADTARRAKQSAKKVSKK